MVKILFFLPVGMHIPSIQGLKSLYESLFDASDEDVILTICCLLALASTKGVGKLPGLIFDVSHFKEMKIVFSLFCT